MAKDRNGVTLKKGDHIIVDAMVVDETDTPDTGMLSAKTYYMNLTSKGEQYGLPVLHGSQVTLAK
jgi:hypothetical protein